MAPRSGTCAFIAEGVLLIRAVAEYVPSVEVGLAAVTLARYACAARFKSVFVVFCSRCVDRETVEVPLQWRFVEALVSGWVPVGRHRSSFLDDVVGLGFAYGVH
jgi:hypothetical protein